MTADGLDCGDRVAAAAFVLCRVEEVEDEDEAVDEAEPQPLGTLAVLP